jgi:ribosomal protein S19
MTRFKFQQTENDVKKLVKKWYDVRGAWSYAPIQRGMGEHGIPDRVGCVPVTITPEMVGMTIGVFVGVEAKKPGRRGEENAGAVPSQVGQLRGINDAQGVGALVDGTHDLDVLEAIMLTVTKGRNIAKDIFERRVKGG